MSKQIIQNVKKLSPKLAIVLIGLLVAVPTISHAANGAGQRTSSISDPLEPVNRAFFTFNSILDMILIEPVAKVYNAVVPSFARDSVQSFVRNLRTPLTFANNLLQGEVGDAGVTTARFIINTTVGLGGLIDVASTQGLEYKREDLGQTMGVWGVGNGPYLVLPLIGSSSLRDTAGMTVEAFADPLRIWAFESGHDRYYYIRNGVEGLDKRARLVDGVEDLRRNSIDYYATVRSAYVQSRDALIYNNGRATSQASSSYDDMPDYYGTY